LGKTCSALRGPRGSKAAAETGAASGQVLSSTKELSEQATRMSDEIDKFLGEIRSA